MQLYAVVSHLGLSLSGQNLSVNGLLLVGLTLSSPTIQHFTTQVKIITVLIVGEGGMNSAYIERFFSFSPYQYISSCSGEIGS